MLAYEPSVSFFCIYQAHTVFWKPRHLGLISGITDIHKSRLWIQMSTPWRAVTLLLRRPPRSCVTAKDCGGRIFSPSPSHLPPKYLQAEMEEFENKTGNHRQAFEKLHFQNFFRPHKKAKPAFSKAAFSVACVYPPLPSPPPLSKWERPYFPNIPGRSPAERNTVIQTPLLVFSGEGFDVHWLRFRWTIRIFSWWI